MAVKAESASKTAFSKGLQPCSNFGSNVFRNARASWNEPWASVLKYKNRLLTSETPLKILLIFYFNFLPNTFIASVPYRLRNVPPADAGAVMRTKVPSIAPHTQGIPANAANLDEICRRSFSVDGQQIRSNKLSRIANVTCLTILITVVREGPLIIIFFNIFL